jgi:hypothetical protein
MPACGGRPLHARVAARTAFVAEEALQQQRGRAAERPDLQLDCVCDGLRGCVHSPLARCQRRARAQVHGDVRMIKSVLYASELSLRFPRVNSVHKDKNFTHINTCIDLRDMVVKKESAHGALPLRPPSARAAERCARSKHSTQAYSCPCISTRCVTGGFHTHIMFLGVYLKLNAAQVILLQQKCSLTCLLAGLRMAVPGLQDSPKLRLLLCLGATWSHQVWYSSLLTQDK